MKSLYESILDVDLDTQQMPILSDEYELTNAFLDPEGIGMNLPLTKYFDWRKVQSYCKKMKYHIETVWAYDGVPFGELIAICKNVQVLGFEQNILGALRMFLKDKTDIVLDDSRKIKDSIYLTYKLTSHKTPAYSLFFHLTLQKRK